MRDIHYFLCLFLLSLPVYAQKNTDCVSSRTICGNTNFTVDNVNGAGLDDFENPNNQKGCLASGENQSAWYIFYIQTSGVLNLDIIPLQPTDYDFAIYGPNVTCDSLGEPVRCNFAGGTGSTGLKTGGGAGYSDSLQVQAGEFYYILIDNFLSNNFGFSLEWKGTASFVSTNTTAFTASVSCNVAKFTNKSVFCASVVAYSWNFGDGSPITSENSQPNPTHNYMALGNYTATLTATIVDSPTPSDIGVVSTFSMPISVASNPPVVQITNLGSLYCETNNSFDLLATPSGGKFSVRKANTVFFEEMGFFAPALLGVGKHEVKYTFSNSNNPDCVGTDIRIVEVVAKPEIILTNLGSDYCISSTSFTLTATPVGGTFSINGINTDFFDPAQLGSGIHTVRYEIPVVGNSPCPNFVQRTVRVTQPSDIVINYLLLREKYCIGVSGFVIQVAPLGGTMTINGVVTPNRFFDIQALGIGVHTVNYTVRNAGGCVNNKVVQIEVIPAPTLSFVNLKSAYCRNEPAFNLQALPAGTGIGAVFRINGVVATVFNPSALGVGTYVVSYFYRDASNPTCSNTITQVVKIGIAPTASISSVAPEYCNNSIIDVQPQINVTYGDGTFEFLFPPSLIFNPINLPVGDHVISYVLTDPLTGCTSTFTYITKILPVTPVSFVDLKDTYCKEALPTTLKANVMGGVFTVKGNAITVFNPNDFAVGEVVEVRYDYAHPISGCPTLAIKNITITDNPYQTTSQKHRLCPAFQPDYFIEAISEEEEQELIAQGITPFYDWSNGVGNVRRIEIDRASYEGTFTVFVRDVNTCPVSKRIFEVDIDCEPKFFVPDAFTPNEDAYNPTLKLFGEFVGKLDFRIYNRWGEVIFISSKLTENWDGKINGLPAPSGVYVWQASYENILVRGSKVRKQGKVFLIR